MDIACNDIAVLNIKGALNAQQEQMRNKYKELKGATKENKFLVGVVRDYARYLNYIKTQKQTQYESLKKISEYIDRISRDADITERMLRQTKHDQKEILDEMSKVKAEINKIIVDKDDL